MSILDPNIEIRLYLEEKLLREVVPLINVAKRLDAERTDDDPPECVYSQDYVIPQDMIDSADQAYASGVDYSISDALVADSLIVGDNYDSRDIKDYAFRISATRQFDPQLLEARRSRYTVGNPDDTLDLELNFYEWRGRRHAYLPLVESHFIFECHAKSPKRAHDLWELLDKFLHDPQPNVFGRRIFFGKLFVYFCLRSQLPQLYLETQSRLGGPTYEFASAYRIMYSEQEE